MLTESKYQHPSAWTTNDVATKNDIAYALSEHEIAVLDDALNNAKRTGKSVTDITQSDFPIQSIKHSITSWIDEVQEGKGLILLRGFPIDRYSKADCEIIYWGIGTHIGEAQSQSLAGDKLGHVVNIGGKNSRYRAYQNSTELALHTDATDIVGMMCLIPAIEGGLSGYASGPAIYNELLDKHPELLETLCEGFHYHLFGEHEPGQSPITEKIPVFSIKDGYLSISYLRSYIELAFGELGREKTELEERALNTIDEIAHGPGCLTQFMMEPGDILFFNNYIVLHNRTAFEDAEEPENRRHLMRLWLKAHNPRPIIDNISAFGKRNGISKQEGRKSIYEGKIEYKEYAMPKLDQ